MSKELGTVLSDATAVDRRDGLKKRSASRILTRRACFVHVWSRRESRLRFRTRRHTPTTATSSMPPPPTPHRTPLRRVSQGSLFRLSRSDQADPSAPYGLGFLDPALAELADEVEALYSNVEGLKQLGDSLEEFNESFASWLYVMNMNALTVDWPQVCTSIFEY